MTNNILLGLGGSGSKSVEAMLHLAAAGLGPREAWLALVDQDENNGNLRRTAETLAQYRDLQAIFRQADGIHELPPTSPLFKTQFAIPKRGAVWCPVGNSGAMTLARLFNREAVMDGEGGGLGQLFDVLFTKEEQRLPFAGGYRGKPAVGAAAILARSLDRSGLWPELSNKIRQLQGGEGGRIFLMGSIFGGTGAASLPTLARMIRAQLPPVHDRKVEVGAVLLLPYFTFAPSAKRNDPNVAHAESLLEQAQAALGYYAQMMKALEQQTDDQGRPARPLFDTLYLVGYTPSIFLEKYSEAGENQCNPPLLPELIAGLAACDFFASGPRAGGRLRFLSAQESDQITWGDLPPVGGQRPEVVLGQYVRFCHQINRVYAPTLNPHDRSRWLAHAWYRDLVDRPLESAMAHKASVESLDLFAQRSLRWFLTCHLLSRASSQRVELFDARVFHEGTLESDGLLSLKGSMGRGEKKAFRTLVRRGIWPGMAQVFANLDAATPEPQSRGLGTFVHALHAACHAQGQRDAPQAPRRRVGGADGRGG